MELIFLQKTENKKFPLRPNKGYCSSLNYVNSTLEQAIK
jgi:hypothetical protein